MKLRKKTIMGVSLVLGMMLFTTTTFAEITSSNGYQQIKDALKLSAENCTSKFNNYTISTSFAIKDGETLVFQDDQNNKYDNINCKQELAESISDGNQKIENYNYSDKNGTVNYDSTQGVYHQIKYQSENIDQTKMNNQFKESGESDIEKIIDALVGNLKDYAVVEQKSDGSKEISGSISESQIPAIVNAVVSYGVKYKVYDRYPNQLKKLPDITNDVYVKEIKVSVIVDKDGIIQNMVGTGIIEGKDEQSNVHEMTFDVFGKLSDINSTSINQIDLTGKKVVSKTQQSDTQELEKPEMYLGTYKNDIVIEEDNEFKKIGEKSIVITQIDNKTISGRYHEEYIKGYEQYSKDAEDYNFNASFMQNSNTYAEFENKDIKGNSISGYISINPGMADIYFGIKNTTANDSSQFNRVYN